MAENAIYIFSRCIGLGFSLAALVAMIHLGRDYWAILPAVLCVVLAVSLLSFDPDESDENTNDPEQT
jgi:uncharacterized membrane protein YkgB